MNVKEVPARALSALARCVSGGLLLVTLAAITLLSGSLAGSASATPQAEGARQPELRSSPVAGSPEAPGQTGQTTQADPTCKDRPRISTKAIVQLVLNPDAATVGVGQHKAYTARLEIADRYSLDVTCWTHFAIKEPNGSCTSNSCTATQPGDYTVRGTFPKWERLPTVRDTAHLRVVRTQPVSLRLRPDPATIEPGGTVTYTATGVDAAGHDLDDLTDKARFSIEGPDGSDGSCPNGGSTCTATKVGDYAITGSVDLGERQVTGMARLRVKPGRLDKLTLSPNPATIVAGHQLAFKAEGFDARGNRLGDFTGEARFSIDGSSGSCTGNLCTATKVGNYTVTGTVTVAVPDPGPNSTTTVSGTATLTVLPGPLDRLILSPNPATIVAGAQLAFTAAGLDAFGNPVDSTTFEPVFSIGPDGSCTGGTCTATKVGPHTVTCKVDGTKATGTAALQVEPGPLARLTLSPSSATIPAGVPQPYTAAGLDAFGNPVDSTTFEPVFSIGPDGSCTGNACSASKPGDHTVTGTADLGDRQATGTAVLKVEPVPARLELRPGSASIPLGRSRTYTVLVQAKDGSLLEDVTAKARLAISPDGTCQGASCTPAAPGEHTVTAVLPGTNLSGTAKLRVQPHQVPPRLPSIASVTPGSTPPARVVEVRGNTGSCNQAGTLAFHGPTGLPTAVAADQQGHYVTRFTVPTGTFPKAYKLELRVDCKGLPQRAEGTLTVTNHPPVAVDDAASTPQGTAVAVAVTRNDGDPDGDGDYPTLVFEQSLPTHGTTQVRPDGTIVYTPDPGFVGQDRFRYSNCDVLVPRNAAGRWKLACGTATVTVTVNPSVPPPSGPSTSGPSTSVPPPSAPTTTVPPPSAPTTTVPPPSAPTTSTSRDCQPRPGDVRSFRVDPGKGPSGAQLDVTGKADRRLAACPLGLLLGGSRLGPDLVVQPDGAISQRLPVPDGVKPGASTLGLATPGGQVLVQVPFEVLPTAVKNVPPWWRGPVWLLVAGAAFALGVLARATTRRWRRVRDDRQRQREAVPQYLRAEPHARPVQTALDQTTKDAPSFTIGLRPHRDAGTQTLTEVTR